MTKKKVTDEIAETPVVESVETQTEALETTPATVSAEEYEALQTKFNDLNDSHLRLMAEFDNYRKRSMREKADLLKSASEGIMVDILPLIDDFERGINATENVSDVSAVREGILLIYEKFINFLAQNGVKPIDTNEQPFDTEYHEAITTISAPNEEMKGKVMDCVQKGYTLNDKVIRFAKVVVGQ